MKNNFISLLVNLIIISGSFFITNIYAGDWKPAENPLFTRWVEDVNPDNVWSEYPRPQLHRDDWLNLNGIWNYTITDNNDGIPESFKGEILVPFPIESALSGVKKNVGENHRLWYQCTFKIPEYWQDRIILHFGAVDWECTVWLNGEKLGSHRGGYTFFSFDITDYLKSGEQKLVVSVWDPTDKWTQPRGKQVSDPNGIWYTSVTGIWQTVWLESVPRYSIIDIDINADVDRSVVDITSRLNENNEKLKVKAVVLDNGKVINGSIENANVSIELFIQNPKLWSPDSPFLYDLKLTLLDEGEVNCLMTYDRKVVKYDTNIVRRLHNKLYTSLPVSEDIIATSKMSPQEWKYRFEVDQVDWADPDLNDDVWKEGPGTFHSPRDPVDQAFPTGIEWSENKIYLRTSVNLDTLPSNLWLQFYIDASESELFINGVSVKRWEKFRYNRRHYRHENISAFLNTLKLGKNVIAIYAEKERERSAVDIGLYTLRKF